MLTKRFHATCHYCGRNFVFLNLFCTRTCGAGRPHVWLCHALLVIIIIIHWLDFPVQAENCSCRKSAGKIWLSKPQPKQIFKYVQSEHANSAKLFGRSGYESEMHICCTSNVIRIILHHLRRIFTNCYLSWDIFTQYYQREGKMTLSKSNYSVGRSPRHRRLYRRDSFVSLANLFHYRRILVFLHHQSGFPTVVYSSTTLE